VSRVDITNETPETAVGGSGSPDEGVESLRERNARLRTDLIAAQHAKNLAVQSGCAEDVERASWRVDDLLGELLTLNSGLVAAAGGSLLQGSTDSDDHRQAGMLGLLEALVGTDPETAGATFVDDDGVVHSVAGWDPDKATLGTHSRYHIKGRMQRSVCAVESKFQGKSYTSFQQNPQITSARAELREELGREPRIDEVAARAGVTRESVAVALQGTPVSLSTPVGDDEGSVTLGDLIKDVPADVYDEASAQILSEAIERAAEALTIVDVLTFVLRNGLAGTPSRSVIEVASILGLGRGAVNNAARRSSTAVTDQLVASGMIRGDVVAEPGDVLA